MALSISGILKAVAKEKPKWDSGGSRIQLKMKPHIGLIQDDLLHGRHKNHWVSIDPRTNKVVDGTDLIDRLQFGATARKICITCDFKLTTTANRKYGEPLLEGTQFPTLYIQQESLNFTMKRGKHISINNFYSKATTPDAKDIISTSISIDGKQLSNVFMDMSKIMDVEHLTRRLKTIIVFQ